MNEEKDAATNTANDLVGEVIKRVAKLLSASSVEIRFALDYHNELPVFESVTAAADAFDTAAEEAGVDADESDMVSLNLLSWLGLCTSFDDLLDLYDKVALTYHLHAYIQEKLVSLCENTEQANMLEVLFDDGHYASHLLGLKMVALHAERVALFQIVEGLTKTAYSFPGKEAEEKLLRMELDEHDIRRILKTASSVEVTKAAIQKLFYLMQKDVETGS